MEKLIEIFIDKYMNRQEVLYRVAPKINIDEFWEKLLAARKRYALSTSLLDKQGEPFWIAVTPKLAHNMDYIDEMGLQEVFSAVEGELADKLLLEAVLDEAFFSSVIEGAFSTKQRTAELIATHSAPVNKSEQMILNNYQALHFLLENLDKPLDETMILAVYRRVTQNTLEADDVVAKYRTGPVYVWDAALNNAIYEAPAHAKVQEMMDSLVRFIQDDSDGLHPVLKACMIHMYFVYIHPFFEGNGRTARAISYMYLLQRGYGFFKFFSISSIVREHKAKYYKAIKDTEDYGSDMTYFALYYTDMIVSSIRTVLTRFRKEYSRKLIKECLGKMGVALSKRQARLVNVLSQEGKNFVTIEEYVKKFKVVYETGRSDLNQLVEIGLLTKAKVGNKFVYKLVQPETFYALCKQLD